jgi:hypothetical protein
MALSDTFDIHPTSKGQTIVRQEIVVLIKYFFLFDERPKEKDFPSPNLPIVAFL